ncbi:MAG TPA: hypothetical protein VF855_10640 [Acidimicrobiales bacterium]
MACGARFRPTGVAALAYLVLLGALIVALAAGVTALWKAADDQGKAEAARDGATKPTRSTVPVSVTQPGDTAITASTVPGPVQAVKPVQIVASATAGASRNNCGETVSYDAKNAIDENPATGWRTRGDGTGETLTLTLPGPTRLTEVGLLPGYAKFDPCSNVDRFPQLRRVTKVRWTFDGGVSVDQQFADKAEIQVVPVDVATTTVIIEVMGTTGKATIDYTPISEIKLTGRSA